MRKGLDQIERLRERELRRHWDVDIAQYRGKQRVTALRITPLSASMEPKITINFTIAYPSAPCSLRLRAQRFRHAAGCRQEHLLSSRELTGSI